MKRLAVLGSTGSIGTATLDVVESLPGRLQVSALAAGRNLEVLRRQIACHRPSVVAVADVSHARTLAREFADLRCVAGAEGLAEVACEDSADLVVSALVGTVGLAPTVAAIRNGKDIALANKEILVAAGSLMMDEVRRAGVQLLPIDSEHSAIHQILGDGPIAAVQRIVLTASGGPFRNWSMQQMAEATVSDALAHPAWKMGPKISVDSATLMNKGLEIIEAHHLFDFPASRIDVVVHPQSVIHSLLEFVDGSTIAQLSINDMRCAILYALVFPDRVAGPLPALDLLSAPPFTFEPPDHDRFPAIGLARSALDHGGEMPAVLNAANEVAVTAFIGGSCAFTAITAIVADTVEAWTPRNRPLEDFAQLEAVDAESRTIAADLVKYHASMARSE